MVLGKNNDYSSDDKRKSVVKSLHGPKRKSLMHQLHGSNPINSNEDDNDSDGNSDETEQDNAEKGNSTENSSIEIGEKWSTCPHTAIYKSYRETVFNVMTADNMIQPDNDTDNGSAEKTQTSVVKHLHGPKRKSVASHTHGRNPDNLEKDESEEKHTERGAGEIKI